MVDPDQIAEFLSRYRVGGDLLSAQEVRAAADRIRELTNLSDAELTARGYRHLTVAHGDIETAEDDAAVHQLRSWADRHAGAVARTRGTNDTTTWLLTPPDADTHLAALEAVA
jgi:hypothetical protein